MIKRAVKEKESIKHKIDHHRLSRETHTMNINQCRLCMNGLDIVIVTLLLLLVNIQEGHTIDCFKCVSYNGANKACDDPFHNNYSTAILESPCMGGRKGRDGLFPATACIKIAGYYDDTGESITVRGCALDSGTLTTDTEIIRMSHCGKFYYDDRYVHGCLQSCSDGDACNSVSSTRISKSQLQSYIILCLLIFSFMNAIGWSQR